MTIFLSYSSHDREAAETVQRALEQAGVGVWRDRTRLETDWSREIASALASGSDAVCLLWSEGAALSKWVGHEWLTARALGKRIFPCLLDSAPPLPEPLRSLDAIGFTDLDHLVQRVRAATSFIERYDFTVVTATTLIPFRPNPEFEGRQTDLLTLYLNLVGNLRKTGLAHVGLGGMAGVGKTQLAVEFVHRFAFAFQHIFWVQAADTTTWLDQFVEIARDRLALPIELTAPTPKQYLLRLQAHCREHQPVLIVMDNVQDPDDLNNGRSLEGLTPLDLSANVLFTTRRRFDLSDVGVIEQSIDIISSEAALSLLTGGTVLPTPQEEEAARDICTAVGRLPLAIVLIAAFLKKRPIRYTDYARSLHAKGLGAIDLGRVSESQLATRHTAAVRETLAEDWQLVQNETARQLATLLALCPESSIVPKPRLGLLAGLELGDELLDPIVEAFVELHDLRLVEELELGASARLHPLVRDFLNELSSDSQRERIRVDAATRLAIALSDPMCLVRQTRSRGVVACILDLKAVFPWAPNLASARLLHRVLDREQTHTQAGARLLQQWHSCAFSMGLSELAARFEEVARREEHPFLRKYAVSAMEDTSWLQSFRRHTGRVTTVCFCPDGRALTGSTDGTLILWDAAFGQPIRTLTHHKSAVRCVAVGPDGRRAVSGAVNGSMIVWDLGTGKPLNVIKAHSASLESIAVSPDGRRALSGSLDKSVVLWDLETGHKIRTYLKHTEWVNAACFDVDCTRAISGSQDKTIVVWDLESGTAIRTFDRHSERISGVSVRPDGRFALTCSYEEALMWELDSGEIAQVLRYSPYLIRCVCFTPDGTRALTGHSNGAVMLWDLDSGRAIHEFEGHTDTVSTVSVSTDGRLALSGSHDGSAMLWSLGAFASTAGAGHAGEVTNLAFAPDGTALLSAAEDQTVVLWSAESGRLLTQLKTLDEEDTNGTSKVRRADFTAGFRDDGQVVSGPYKKGTLVWNPSDGHAHSAPAINSSLLGRFSHDGRRALIGLDNRRTEAEYWDLATGTVLSRFGGQPIRTACFVGDGAQVLVGGDDGHVALWTPGSDEEVRRMEPHHERVTSVCVDTGGLIALSVGTDAKIIMSKIETGETVRSFSSLDVFLEELIRIDLSADGKTAVTLGRRIFGRAGGLVLWNLELGEPIRWTDAAQWIRTVCINPEDATVFAGGEGGQLAQWHLETGQPVQSFTGHADAVQSICCSRDGRLLFSAGHDGTVRSWDVASGKALRSFNGHRGEVKSLAISDDGRRLLSGSSDRTMILWDTGTGEALCTYLSNQIEEVALSRDGRHAVSVAHVDGFAVWDVDTGQSVRMIDWRLEGILDACFTPDGSRVVTVSKPNTLTIWNIDEARPVAAVRYRSGLFGVQVKLSPDGRRALILGGDRLYLYDIDPSRELRALQRRGRTSVKQACLSPDGSSALASYTDGALVLWDLRSGGAMTEFFTTGPATAIDWQGSRIALGDADGIVSLWELHNR
jgi:WD40 repeat protein